MRSIQPSEKSEKRCEKAADLEVFKIVFRQHLRFLFKGMRPNPGRIPIWIKHSQAMQRTVAGAVGSSAERSTFPFRRRKKEKPRQTKRIPDGFPLPSQASVRSGLFVVLNFCREKYFPFLSISS